MQVFSLIVILIVAVSGAMIIQNWLLKKISINYIALVIGIILAVFSKISLRHFVFEPEVFMGLIVAPLLFFEGQRSTIYAILKSWKSIVGVTVLMIVIATIAAAFGVKIATGLSLPLSFVLAAISTPTDATATESVSYGFKIPERVAIYLKNESLFNDASGIILLNMAITWTVSQHLKIIQTLGQFIYSTGGGIILGALISALLILIRQKLLRKNAEVEDDAYNPTTALIVIYILTPIMIYFLAEEVHISGIIAVVVSGLVHHAEAEKSRLTNLKLIYSSREVGNLIRDILNGLVFVILGIVITNSLKEVQFSKQVFLSIKIGLILYLANLVVRYLYSTFVTKLNNHEAWIFSLGGIHGAVTFALAYTTLDNTLISRANFHLILLSEISLIILSMIIPTILFRFLLDKDESEGQKEEFIAQLKQEMVNYSLEQMSKLYLPPNIRKQLEFDLQAQINETSMKDFLLELRKSVKNPELTSEQREFRDEVYRYAFRLERNYLGQVAQMKQKHRTEFLAVYRETLLAEIQFLNN